MNQSSHQAPKLAPAPTVPAPLAVGVFVAARLQMRQPLVYEALLEMSFAERELRRTCNPLSVEDEGDRQEALAMFARADKTVSSHPERMGSHLRSLS